MSLQYIVSWAQSATGPFGTPNQNTVSSPTDTISGLQPGTGYYFQIVTQDTVTMLSGAPVVVGPVTTTGTSVSPSGTVVGTFVGAATQIVDSAQYTWTLSGGQIYYQPPGGSVTLIGATGAVIALVYYNGAVYQWAGTTAPGNWWSTPPGNPAFATNLGATVPIPASPSGTSIPPSSWIVDTSGNIWFYETPSGGSTGNEIYINGIVSTAPSGGYPTAFVTQMVWAGGTLYQFGSGAWYSLVPTASEVNNPTWVASAAPTGIFINTVVSQIQNQPFAVSGVLSGYTATPTLNYMDITNGVTGSWLALPSGATVSTTSFSFTNPAISVVNTNNSVAVRDTGVLFTGTSTQFPVVSPPTITSIQINGGSTGSFPADSAIGTIIGTLGVTTNTSGFTFNGTYSLPSGVANNADFEIVSGNMLAVANASLPTATYTALVAATQAGITNSPYTQSSPSFSITSTGQTSPNLAVPAAIVGLSPAYSIVFFDDFTPTTAPNGVNSVAPSATSASGYNWYYTVGTSGTTGIANPGSTQNSASFTGSINGTALTVTGTVTGNIAVGHYLSGVGVTVGTKITAGSGTAWTVTPSQTVASVAMGSARDWQNLPLTTAVQISNGNTGAGANASANGGILMLNPPNANSGGVAILSSVPIASWFLTQTNTLPAEGVGNWQWGYFEAYYQVNSAGNPFVGGATNSIGEFTSQSNIAGWPGFWSWSVQGANSFWGAHFNTNFGSGDAIEIDFWETYGGNFSDPSNLSSFTLYDHSVSGTPFATGNASNQDAQWHTYGCLWKSTGNGTGTMSFYRDNTPISGGTNIATTSAVEAISLFLNFSVGENWPLYIDWVRVWQSGGV